MIASVLRGDDGSIMIASGSTDRSACLWSLDDDKFIKRIQVHMDDIIQAVAFSAGERRLATTGGHDKIIIIRIWDLRDMASVRQITRLCLVLRI